MSLIEMIIKRRNDGEKLNVVSAKEATGLLGRTTCIPGNRYKENTVLGIGDEGIQTLIEMGFIPCPVCKLENDLEFRRIAEPIVRKMYGLTVDEYADKSNLKFDAFRVDFERIVRAGGRLPDRLYVDEKASDDEVQKIKSRMTSLGGGVQIGVYDRSASGNFRLR